MWKSDGVEEKKAALLFDLDGVLVDSKARNFVYYSAVFDQAGLTLPPIDKIVSCYHLGLEDAIVALMPSENRDRLSQTMDIAHTTERFREYLRFPDDLLTTLSKMHSQYVQAIVTNAPRNSVDELFESVPGVEECFDTVIDGDMGYAQKPSPEPVHAALKELGVQPQNAAFVGDTARTDGVAARAAGLKFIHLVRPGFEDSDPEADLVIPDIADLPSRLTLSGITQVLTNYRCYR